MQSSNQIGKIVRQYADAVETGKVSARTRKSKMFGFAAISSAPKHRAFVPMITIWGGLLLALITVVLPDFAIAGATSLIGVYLPLLVARFVLAFAIGLGGALLSFIIATAIANRARRGRTETEGAVVSAFKSRGIKPINPTADLGSESLDAPLEDTSHAENEAPAEPAPELAEDIDDVQDLNDLTRRGLEMEAPEEPIERQTSSKFAPLTADRMEPRREKPRSLNLNEFASVPGRNGVWVEEPDNEEPDNEEPESQSRGPSQDYAPEQPEAPSSPAPDPATGLQKLRQTPPEELSLVEMVERFAAALHEHQEHERARAASGATNREAALAEALKALSLFTEEGFDMENSARPEDHQIDKTESELRGALARLQKLRGAA